MIDGSYSFTDISRKLFAGLDGQSGRSFPGCVVLAGNALGRAGNSVPTVTCQPLGSPPAPAA